MLAILLDIATAPATPDTAVDFTWLFFKMLMALGAVSIFAVLVLKYAAPHLSFTRRYQQGKVFDVLARFSLEPKRHLYLTKIAERYFVLGTSESGINVITELSKEEAEKHESS